MKSVGADGLPPAQPTAPPPSDPTRSDAPSVAAPTTPPAISPALFCAPERYHILNEHGRGGLGRVSRAHDRELDRDVAIKELISRTSSSEARFLREAMITARLEHPGIVPMYEAGRWPDGTPYYAMKLVSGRPLRDLIAERTTVDQRIGLLHHVIAVADAIAYAHGRNIIHRDLKPANVIVGDFGETIVIDWGLAKDLSTSAEDPTIAGSPAHSPSSNDLTAAGAVLGTPSYMAPEQERGEHVDQRADVFAIGAMLWELCSLQKVPPTNLRHRHRLLRRAGIDHDLAIILDKALDPDPARRYPDAEALAADLKAFKSGARISARSYSLLSMLVHWTRRHRPLAVSVTALLTLAVAAAALYVRNITAERDRADDALARVQATKEDLVTEHNELTLKHAELLLTTDPSAALDTLSTYYGGKYDRANQLRAEAQGRGVAIMRAVPHHDNVRWAEGQPDGSIVSLSTDGTIVKTLPDQRAIVLARNVAPKGWYAYSPSRGLLAYGCDPANICMWDVRHSAPIQMSEHAGEIQTSGIAFSPSGKRLGLITTIGLLRVFDVSSSAQLSERFHVTTNQGVAILFLDEDHIAVASRETLQVVQKDRLSRPLVLGAPFFWEASADGKWMVLGMSRGEAHLVDLTQMNITKHMALCRSAVTALRFVPQQPTIAYSCRDGTIGLWNLQTDDTSPLTHLEGHADMIEVTETGDSLIGAGGNGTFTVIDLVTNLITTYRGHRARLTAMIPATEQYPFHISADVRGVLRVWPLPRHLARVAGNVHTRFVAGAFGGKSDTLIASTFLPTITTFSPSTGVRAIGPHLRGNNSLEIAADAERFATYGSGESIEIWSSRPMARTAVINTHHGSVSKVSFVDSSDAVLTSGRDGRIIHWTSASMAQTRAQFAQPIATFVQTLTTRSLAVATADGALWQVGEDGRVRTLRPAGSPILRLLVLPDSATLCVGYANGDVFTIDTKTDEQSLLLHASEAIRDIAVTAGGDSIAVAAHNDLVYVGRRNGPTWKSLAVAWRTFSLRARRIVLTADGLLLAIDTDGNIWIYSIPHQTFEMISTGISDLRVITISHDSKNAIALDTDGRILYIDLDIIRSKLTTNTDTNLEVQPYEEALQWLQTYQTRDSE